MLERRFNPRQRIRIEGDSVRIRQCLPLRRTHKRPQVSFNRFIGRMRRIRIALSSEARFRSRERLIRKPWNKPLVGELSSAR